MLPGYVQRGLAKVGVGAKYTGWMTSGYRYLLCIDHEYSLPAQDSLKAVNLETASAIATGTAINA